MEGMNLFVWIQYVVEYRFACAFFQIIVDGFKRVSSWWILCRFCRHRRIDPENAKCWKTKFNNHIKVL